MSRSEAEFSSLRQYKTVSEFFRRRLKPGLRPVCQKSQVVSPADGSITYRGVFTGPWLQQVKGVNYSLGHFLGPLDSVVTCNRKEEEEEEYIQQREEEELELGDGGASLENSFTEDGRRLLTRSSKCTTRYILHNPDIANPAAGSLKLVQN